MAEAVRPHDPATCRVRGCPIVMHPATLSEWGADGFLIASYHAPTTIPSHAHFPLQLSLPTSGSWLHTFGNAGSTVLMPGMSALIPPGDTHGTRGLAAGELITINAELEWCEEHCDLAAPALRDAKRRTGNAAHLQLLLAHASELLREHQPDELYIASVGLTTTLGVIHAFGLRARPGTRIRLSAPLRRVTRWVDEHLGDRITLSTLARVAGCSQWHLIRLFNAGLGTSPARYVVTRRLERSRQLLRTPGAGIADVALRCGFSSQSHFTRAFVRAFGQSPGAYRSKRSTL
jgi:AraC-like DNA-binding protein